MKTCHFWLKFCIVFIFMYICILLMTIKSKQQDISKKNEDEKLVKVLLELDFLQKNNAKLNHRILVLRQRLRIITNSELYYYVSSELWLLAKMDKDIKSLIIRMKKNINEQHLSLLTDIAELETVDDHTRWRRKEFIYLRTLVQKRLRFLQNPEDCSKAKKLYCNLISDRRSCGYSCRLHHIVNCLVVAYATKRTMFLDNPDNWGFASGEFSSLFFPLSSACTSPLDNNETVLPWPGNESVQVVNLSLPILPNDSHRKGRPLPLPFDPLVLPKDLSSRIQILHGDPSVWWIGQFVNYIIRPQLSTIDMFDAYEYDMEFQRPAVGVQIMQTDKIGSPHKLEEYMKYVEKYYELQQMNGKNLFKIIYLATDDPTLFEEAYKKYPDYKIYSNPELYKNGSFATRELDQSMNIDLFFLSQCDYLVCTSLSHVCRLAYEIINGIKYSDASTLFISLDDVYHFSDQIRRLHVAILPHKSNTPQEMDLQVGDEIEVTRNELNGYSKGTHLRTNKTLLYPTFKVIQKIEVMNFESYNDIQISSEELED